MNWKRVSAVGLGVAISAAVVGSSFAALPDDREATMKHIKRAYRPLAEMFKKSTFDANEAGKRGNEIAAYLQQFKDLFPAGSERADDKASPNIWTNRAGFETARTNAYAAALAVTKATDAASFLVAYKTLGGTCTSCHDKFATLK